MTSTAADRASVRDRLWVWFKDELSLAQLSASLNAALMLYVLEIILTLSIVALIFSGSLADQLPYAVGFVLIGEALLVATVTVLSSYGGSIAVAQDTSGVILALAVAAIVAGSPAGETADTRFATVLLLLVGSTLAMGLLSLVLGVFKLGRLVRFLPFPVVGGFLAGSGWLLTVGGIGVATGTRFGMGLLQPGMLVRWLPAFALGLVALLVIRRWKNPLALAALLVGAALTFYGLIWVLGIPLTTLTAEGWLLGPFPNDLTWRFPLDPQTLAHVNWPVLLSAIPVAAPALLIAVIALLLNASGLELVIKRDVGLNRELMVTGAANLLSGLTGGLIGYLAISFSTLNYTLGKGKRLPGLLIAVLLILTLSTGTTFLALLPRPLLGGLLIYIGLALLYEWVIQSWSSFPRMDYFIVLSILIIIALKDFLWGVGFGLIMAILLFVVSSSRLDVIRYELSGATYRSRVNRSLQQWMMLQTHGDQLLIFKLHGFIFFGTANNVFERVRARSRRASAPVRYLLLDFEQVTGLDSTALLSFSRLLQWARENEIALIMSGLTARARNQLRKGGFIEQTAGLRLFADMDRGIEWCEDQIVASVPTAGSLPASLQAQLLTILPDQAQIAALIRHLHRREVAAGEHIIRQGDEPDHVFFVESGQLTAQLEKPGRAPVRLETMQGGYMVGELGFFLGTRRNASVVADRPSVVYFLTREDWDQMTKHAPEVAQTCANLVIRLLGQRVAHLTRAVDALVVAT
jgi:SulP family sulfate permease